MDAVADGECAVDLEWIAKSGDVADVGDKLLAVAEILVLRIEVVTLCAIGSTRKISPVSRSSTAVWVIGTWLMALWNRAGDFVPANAAKQDHMTGEVISLDTVVVSRWNTLRLGFSARRCP